MTLSSGSPPRAVERVLTALGADSEFSDTIVGDLAEEFVLRARWDGVTAARRWYCRECVRVAPYLLRDWWRGRRLLDAPHVIKAVAVSSLLVYGLEKMVARALAPAVLAWWRVVGQSPAYLGSMLCWTMLDGLLLGYLVARIGRRAPVVGTLAATGWWLTFWVGMNLLGGWRFDGSMGQLWYRALNPLMLCSGIMLGGLWRVARRAPSSS